MLACQNKIVGVCYKHKGSDDVAQIYIDVIYLFVHDARRIIDAADFASKITVMSTKSV